MLRVTSLAEKEIHEIGEAFANHNYVDGGMGTSMNEKSYAILTPSFRGFFVWSFRH